MSDEEMKKFLKGKFTEEADRILQEVEADEEVSGIEAPSEIDKKLYEEIARYEWGKRRPDEEKELLRMGQIYQRKLKCRKYVVATSVLIATMVVGITSLGGPERIMLEFNRIVAGRDQVTLDSDNEDILETKVSEEEEAYQKIKDEFGFEPVRMLYLPEGMKFEEATISTELYNVQISYSDNKEQILHYQINFNYQEGSTCFDIEDKLLEESVIKVKGVNIKLKTYAIEEDVYRISGAFKVGEIQYLIFADGIRQNEFEKVIKNLKI